jgi:hypothetical protein
MKLVLIDSYAKDWIHYSFNSNFLGFYKAETVIFLGLEESLVFKEYDANKGSIPKGLFKKIIFFFRELRQAKAEKIVFIAITNKQLLLALFLRILGFDVSYVMHKLNLRSRILKLHWRILYFIADKFNLRALCFESPHPMFKSYEFLPGELLSFNKVLPPPKKVTSAFKVIAFIGEPLDGKGFELLQLVAQKNNLKITIYSDTYSSSQYEVLPYNDQVTCCDFIWGYYSAEHYQGIQSGLPYCVIASNIPVITNRNIGFGSFAAINPNFCIPLTSESEIDSFLKNFYLQYS